MRWWYSSIESLLLGEVSALYAADSPSFYVTPHGFAYLHKYWCGSPYAL
jgi:hypothetical protein